MSTVQEDAGEVLRLIESDGWWQAPQRPPWKGYCLAQAIDKVSGDLMLDNQLMNVFAGVIAQRYPRILVTGFPSSNVVRFNDHKSTTFEDIIFVCKDVMTCR